MPAPRSKEEHARQQAAEQSQSGHSAARRRRRRPCRRPCPGRHGARRGHGAGRGRDARGGAQGSAAPSHRDALAAAARSRLKSGRIDDLVLVKYHETVDPKSPNVVLFSPTNSPQSLLRRVRLGGAGHHHAEAARPRHAVERRRQPDADAVEPGDAHLGQRRRASSSSARSPSTTSTCSRSSTRSRTAAPQRSRSRPTPASTATARRRFRAIGSCTKA